MCTIVSSSIPNNIINGVFNFNTYLITDTQQLKIVMTGPTITLDGIFTFFSGTKIHVGCLHLYNEGSGSMNEIVLKDLITGEDIPYTQPDNSNDVIVDFNAYGQFTLWSAVINKKATNTVSISVENK